jgi:hypothetical protein
MKPNTRQFAAEEWQQVAPHVDVLLPAAMALHAAHNKTASKLGLLPLASVSWHPEEQRIVVYTPKPQSEYTKSAYVKNLGVACAVVFVTAPPTSGILVKAASGFLPAVGSAWRGANAALGGPTPLSHAIVSGLALGGLGYGTGAIAEQLIPERMLEQGRLRKTLGLAGLLAGGGIGAVEAGTTARELDQGFFKSFVTDNRTPIPPKKAEYDVGKKANAFFPDNMHGLRAPTIKVDAFNRAIWADARTGYNHTGIIDGYTSPQVAAAATGIMSGISRQAGSSIISPATVVNSLASAGVGLITANVAGRALGALAGLSPFAQEKLQDAGLWGGMMHTIIPPLFGGR